METLNDIWEFFIQQLRRGVVDNKSPFHLPVFISKNEKSPNPRVVVLRKFEVDPFRLSIHTDSRSEKFTELNNSPDSSWLFWNPRSRVQLRMYGSSKIYHKDEQSLAAWKELSPGTQKNYSAQIGPGSAIDHYQKGIDTYHRAEQVTNAQSQSWYEHFCLITSSIYKIEFLQLDPKGHIRAEFTRNDVAKNWNSQWLVP